MSPIRKRGLVIAGCGLLGVAVAAVLLRAQLAAGAGRLLIPGAALAGWIVFGLGLFQALVGAVEDARLRALRVMFLLFIAGAGAILTLGFALPPPAAPRDARSPASLRPSAP